MPISCKEFQSFISEYIDGEISDSLKSGIEAHLSSCSHCSLVLKSTLSLKSYLRNLKKVKTSPNFETALRQRLRNEIGNPGTNKEKRFLAFHSIPLKPALGTCFGVVVLASAVVIFQNYHSNSDNQAVGSKPINNRVIDNQVNQPLNFPPGQATSQGLGKTGSFNPNSRSVTITSTKSDSNKNKLNIKEVKNKK